MGNNKVTLEVIAKRLELLEMKVQDLNAMDKDVLEERFKKISDSIFSTKDTLNLHEAAEYLSISESLLYKLTMKMEIPFFRPRAKLIYFHKKELDEWALGRLCQDEDDINTKSK